MQQIDLKGIIRTTLLLPICLIISTTVVQAQPGNNIIMYRNPVIAGDFPDPTVIRVGKIYYAAGTTSDFGNFKTLDINGIRQHFTWFKMMKDRVKTEQHIEMVKQRR